MRFSILRLLLALSVFGLNPALCEYACASTQKADHSCCPESKKAPEKQCQKCCEIASASNVEKSAIKGASISELSVLPISFSLITIADNYFVPVAPSSDSPPHYRDESILPLGANAPPVWVI